MRVRRYFAFVDLCGFTRFTEVHGDEEAVAGLTDFRLLVRDVAARPGVRVGRWLGGGGGRGGCPSAPTAQPWPPRSSSSPVAPPSLSISLFGPAPPGVT